MSRTSKRSLVLVGVLLVTGALMWKSWTERSPQPVLPPVWSDSTGSGLRAVTLWFGSPGADSLMGELRELPEQPGVHERVAAVVAALEAGPRAGGVRLLPPGTQLVHAYLDEGGLLTLDLSRPFRQGFGGGARAEELVVASLVRTVSAYVPEAKHIRIVCGGMSLRTLGGHFPLDQPLDPEDWL